MDKVLSLLGLSKRAGKLVVGEKQVLKQLSRIQEPVVFLAKDAGDNIIEKINKKQDHMSLVLCRTYTKIALSEAVGMQNQAMMMVIDEGFNDAIKKQL